MVKKFPQEIYLRAEGDGDESWFVVEDKPEHFASTTEKIVAARYRLIEQVVVSAKTTVSVRKSRRRAK